ENLDDVVHSLVALEEHPDDIDALQATFRGVHTLKGNAASLGFEDVAAVAHVAEDLLDHVRARRIALTPELTTVLLGMVDALRAMLARQARESPDGVPGQPREAPPAAASLRVDVSKVDHLLNLVGEVAIAREQLGTLLADMPPGPGALARDRHHDADRLYVDLQEAALSVRMVAAGPALRRYVRVVRDTARSLGKRARLTIEGDDVHVDMHTLQMLKDPLTHIVRNAVAHGVELPEERTARGKDPEGRIVIGVKRDGPQVVVEVRDDGAGIDVDRVKARAVALGLVTEDARMTDRQLQALLFRPGFSTAADVTGVAGRGVGMDVVRRNVESLRGRVEVRSRAGRETVVAMRLPLTVAIISGFYFGVAGQ
ncbi:MAG TPA: ATP-binding protein, partial [Acidimicrobiales bacterium]|nr:ATP-binding protein [Acidimicrobiales bacterium]